MKSCRTQGDFHSSCLLKLMKCCGGLIEGLKEPEGFPKVYSRADLRSKKADMRPEKVNLRLERAE